MKTTSLLLSGVAAVLALSAAPAFAQDAPKAGDQAAAAGDIIVTATRTETRLSKTPVAISAVTGDTLRSQGIVSPTNLSKDVPNLSIDRTNGLQITIRGVTSTDGTEKGDPSAAFLLDGVYLARPQEADVSFFDVSRVEVLRGPQGTLYGKNTTAGVVNVITNKPKLGALGFGLNAGFGNYSAYNVDGYVNVPLGSIAALRVSGTFDQRDNYIKEVPGDTVSINPFRKNFAGRAQLLIKPSADLSVLLRADYADIKGSRVVNVRASNFYAHDAGNTVLFDANGNANPIDGNAAQQLVRSGTTPANTGAGTYGVGNSSSTAPGENDTAYGLEGEINYNFGPATVTYLGSYRHYKANENQLFDAAFGFSIPDVFNGNYSQQSHELRLTANNIPNLKLQGGLYYFKEDSQIALYLFNLIPGQPVFGFPQATNASSKGAYAQGVYSIVPAIRLTLGGRFTSDKKFRYGHTVYQQTLTYTPSNGTDNRFQNSADIANITHSKFTWTAGLDGDVGAHGLLYGKVSTGYKAGGFNDGCTAGTTTFGEACNQARSFSNLYYQPETLTAYEVGYKGRFADDKISVTADVFHYEYKNLQLSQIAPAPGGGINQVTQNAAAARVTGFEFESTLRPDKRNRFDIGFTLTRARYVAYCPKGYITGSTTACGNGVPDANGNITVAGPDFAGRQLDRTPSQSVNLAYTYTYPIAAGGNLAFNVGTKFAAAYKLTDFGAAHQFRVPSATKTDISLTYNGAGDHYYVQAYGSNLENSITLSAIDGNGNATPQDPRTFGVRGGVKF